MILEVRAVPPFYKNGYVVACERTGEGAIIDPGDEIEELLDIVSRRRLAIRCLLLTHAHADHVAGLARARDATAAPIYLHVADRPLYDAAIEQGLLLGLSIPPLPPVDCYYGQDAICCGSLIVRALHTPGHTPGGVCLEVGPSGGPVMTLFSGDTLFAGSIGRTDLPGGDYSTLIRSIETVLMAKDDRVQVYPGHGPSTTIGTERRTNPFLRM